MRIVHVLSSICTARGDDDTATLPDLRSGATTDSALELVGQRIGKYLVRRHLASGGMAHVYQALDLDLRRLVAIKSVHRELLATSPRIAESVRREARFMARLASSHVPQIFELMQTSDGLHIAMELFHGESLGTYVSRRSPSWQCVLKLYEHAGRGLADIHAAGIVHRDFKPHNVLVELVGDRPSRVAVTDLGIAREEAVPTAGEPDTAGTPLYMAPEQLDGMSIDTRADIFAFSVSLWESLFGSRPFDGEDNAELRRAMSSPPRAPAGAPRELVRLLTRGLALDAEHRWSSMTAMVRHLQTFRMASERLARPEMMPLPSIGARGEL